MVCRELDVAGRDTPTLLEFLKTRSIRFRRDKVWAKADRLLTIAFRRYAGPGTLLVLLGPAAAAGRPAEGAGPCQTQERGDQGERRLRNPAVIPAEITVMELRMLRAALCALLVVAATPLGAQEQKQPPRPVQTDVALALVLAVDASGSAGWDDLRLETSPCLEESTSNTAS